MLNNEDTINMETKVASTIMNRCVTWEARESITKQAYVMSFKVQGTMKRKPKVTTKKNDQVLPYVESKSKEGMRPISI